MPKVRTIKQNINQIQNEMPMDFQQSNKISSWQHDSCFQIYRYDSPSNDLKRIGNYVSTIAPRDLRKYFEG